MPNALKIELSGVTKGSDERIDENVFRWFDHIERMKNNRNAKRICVREGSVLEVVSKVNRGRRGLIQ